jgi:hypothetical protein
VTWQLQSMQHLRSQHASLQQIQQAWRLQGLMMKQV